eukprot:scaffold196164_cov35-Attheya_sp.AAC.1
MARGFFEPALAVLRDDNDDERPHLGVGFTKVGRRAGPVRVFVDHRKDATTSTLWWCLTISEPTVEERPQYVDRRNATICEGFGGVKYAFSYCVQQCLAREP